MTDWERRFYHLGAQLDAHLPTITFALLVLLAAAIGWACAERANRTDRAARAYENGRWDAQTEQLDAERDDAAVQRFAEDIELLDTPAGRVLLERIVDRARREDDR